MSKDINIKDLPAPRLQIVWEDGEDEYERTAKYELVIHQGEICKLDCRANDEETGKPTTSNPIKVLMSETRVDGGRLIEDNGDIDTPFRDGCHIMRDSAKLNLPMFVIYKDKAQVIEQDERVLKDWA